MTGITQSPPLPPRRPRNGISSYSLEETMISQILDAAQVEETVERLWPVMSPERIASTIAANNRGLVWMSAKWVESIKRRIDGRQREAQKK